MKDSIARRLLVITLLVSLVGAVKLSDGKSTTHDVVQAPLLLADGPTPWPPAPVRGGSYVQNEIRAASTAKLVADGPTPWPQVTVGTNA